MKAAGEDAPEQDDFMEALQTLERNKARLEASLTAPLDDPANDPDLMLYGDADYRRTTGDYRLV
jgi:hypothetical protein